MANRCKYCGLPVGYDKAHEWYHSSNKDGVYVGEEIFWGKIHVCYKIRVKQGTYNNPAKILPAKISDYINLVCEA